MIVHFTFTGRYAGQTYCGTARNEIDKYMHIKAENTKIMKDLLSRNSPLCLNCKKIYLTSEED